MRRLFYWYHKCCVRDIQLPTNDDEQFIYAHIAKQLCHFLVFV